MNMNMNMNMKLKFTASDCSVVSFLNLSKVLKIMPSILFPLALNSLLSRSKRGRLDVADYNNSNKYIHQYIHNYEII